jgi:AmmeMemoRadiSam system protein B
MFYNNKGDLEMIRKMSVNGRFYPQSKGELIRYFKHFEKLQKELRTDNDISSRVVIVPHAGYIYSGFTASIAYKALQKSGIKRFIVVGPSHKYGFNGMSMCNFDSYATPFGNLNGDIELYNTIKEKFDISCFDLAHAEHSTEVQFPFIKHYIDDAKIVELIYSKQDSQNLAKVLNYLLSFDDVAVIISTDLSHFYPLQKAKELDSICINAIKKLDTPLLEKGCEACGKIGIGAILEVVKLLGIKAHILDYRTSADASEDTSRVVGYLSIAFC